MYNVKSKLYGEQFEMMQFKELSIQFPKYSKCAVYILQCSMYGLQCSVCCVHFEVHNVQFAQCALHILQYVCSVKCLVCSGQYAFT